MHRAGVLFEKLAAEVPRVRSVLLLNRVGGGAMRVVVALAFLLGLSSNALGPSRQIHLLSLPLFPDLTIDEQDTVIDLVRGAL